MPSKHHELCWAREHTVGDLLERVKVYRRCCVYPHLSNVSFFHHRRRARARFYLFSPNVFVVRCHDFVSGFWLNTFKVFFRFFFFWFFIKPAYNTQYTYYKCPIPGRVLFLANSFWNKLVKNSRSTLYITCGIKTFSSFKLSTFGGQILGIKIKTSA